MWLGKPRQLSLEKGSCRGLYGLSWSAVCSHISEPRGCKCWYEQGRFQLGVRKHFSSVRAFKGWSWLYARE